MIYLTNGNTPLNAAYADEIVQIDSNTYQLTFRFPTSDSLWEKLKEETFLTADDLHGEQDFVIFEVEKKHGYIQVYANQVFTLLNNYVINPISLDRQTGSTALSRFAGAITRNNPFSFFSDIEDRHTFNIGSKNAMEAFAKDKHSILGQWGGDLVRHGYQVRLLKNGGSENESLFMYKKNLSSYQHKTSTKSLKTRITFKTTVKGEGEKAPDRKFSVVVDSPLINKYSQIYEDVIEVNDEDVKDEASLRKYGEQYFKTSLCDMMEDSLELEVVGQSDVPVQIYDIVSLFYEIYNLDVRKKITKYTYSPMAKKLKSIGFGQFQSGLANAIGNAVSDAVKGEAQQLQDDFERQLARELKNADLAFDRKTEELKNEFEDGLNATRAKAEEVKRELSDNIDQRFNSFNNGPLQEAKRRAEEALRNAGASSLLAQEAKRIGLDSVAKLEEFKRQATSSQTALSGDLDALKRTIANDIRPKQVQVETEIAKQVEALNQTKKELVGVKSAQATYEETTTQRLAELTNLANGKASKSELTQTAEELASRIASVKVGGRNLLRGSKGPFLPDRKPANFDNAILYVGQTSIYMEQGQEYIISAKTDGTFTAHHDGNKESDNVVLWIMDKDVRNYQIVSDLKTGTTGTKITWNKPTGIYHLRVNAYHKEATKSVWDVKIEKGNVATDWSPALEDIEGQISTVESNFRQRADALDAGVSRLTEGLRTKADISVLNVTAENIWQSVKSLETSTQNKLDQKLSLAEFEVQAGSIRQEILNATKDKADKTLVVAEAGKLREEFSNLRVGGRNLLRGSKGPFLPDRKPANFDNAILYAGNTSIYMEQGQEYIVSAKTDGTFTAHHDGNKESDNVVLWIMDKDVRNYQIVSDLKTGTTGTKIIWNKPTGIYHLRVNTYHKEATKSVWDVKIEKGNVATDWSPAPEDTDGVITEAKATFERTAQGLRTDLSAIQEYVNKDGQRQEALQRYSREESAKQATAVRELVTRDYVGKATYQEDVRGIERKFESITNPKTGSIATQIANYKIAVNGRFAEIISLISGKANQTDFQRVRETSQLYERILGNTDNGIANNVARMAMTNQLFQVEVSKNENLKTVQRQLAGSWAVQNINSAGDLISGINLGANGHNRFVGKLTHITGETLIDKAVIKSAMVDKLKTANFEAGSVTTVILDAEAVTAEKLKVDQAFFNKLVANEAYLSQLFAKQAFINRVQSVAIDASQVRSGILSGDRIYGGTIRGANIYGGTLTGHTQIQLGTYGSFDTVNGGIQINVPRTVNAKDGLGVQFIGSYGRGENVPYGLFIYKDADFTVGGTAETSDDFLLTVEGYINAKGIGWLKTGKGSVNGKTTGTIGLWNSDNVSLSFGGSGNDIYYSYNGTAYSLWSVVNQHFSDRRLKENIIDCEHKALDYIHQFKFKEYDWKKQEDRPQQAHTKIGLIAQEVQAVDPTLVYENGDTLNLDNLRLTNIALKAIQELALENRKLTHRLENLENERRTA
nr:MAG TPA: Neck appendage protein [Caudoviricetes sp.]